VTPPAAGAGPDKIGRCQKPSLSVASSSASPSTRLTLPGGAFAAVSDAVNQNLNDIKRGSAVQPVLDKAAVQAQPVLDRIWKK